MPRVNREQKIALVALAGAGAALWYVNRGPKSGKSGHRSCNNIANRRGATIDTPCPTEGPIDVCTSDDLSSWRERLAMQMGVIQAGREALEATGGAGPLGAGINGYMSNSATIVGEENPVWTSETDIAPVINTIRYGCELLNAINAELGRRGRVDLQVFELEGETFAMPGGPGSTIKFTPTQIAIGALIVSGVYFWARRAGYLR